MTMIRNYKRKYFLGIGLLVAGQILASCASNVPRTKWTDKNMRVMIDPESVSEEEYVQIQSALVKTGFVVIDRARGFNAIKKEQEREHRDPDERMADKERWSLWGRMYGVGSVIVGHSQCTKEHSAFNRTKMYLKCKQFLSILDSNSGSVIAVSEAENDAPASYDLAFLSPDWNEAVEKLVDAYPKEFKPENYSKEIIRYQDIAAEHAQRQRELVEKKKESEAAPDREKQALVEKVHQLEKQLEEQTAKAQPATPPTASSPVTNAESTPAPERAPASEGK